MAQGNIRSTSARATEAFTESSICIAALDPHQRIVDVSAGFLRQFGGTAESRSGQDFHALLHPDTRSRVRQEFQRLFTENRASFHEPIRGIGRGDAVFAGDITGYASRGDGHRITSLVVVIRPDAPGGATRSAATRQRVLTDLDARILEGVAAGASTIQLASRLHLSRQGVEYRIASMFRKLGASNRAALVSRAYAMGALTVGSWPPRVQADFVA